MEKVSNENDSNRKESTELDSMPVLYIAKYNRLIDTGDVTLDEGDNDVVTNSTPLLPKKTKYR